MLHLRIVRPDDIKFIWELANDAEVRAVSFSHASIPWDDHEKWFTAKIKDEGCRFYVAESSSKEKIGQVRFEKKTEGWVISLSIVREFRGKGFGAELIKSASKSFLSDLPQADGILAYIKNDNAASIRAFEKAGYQNAGKASINLPDDAVMMKLNTDFLQRANER